MSSAKKEKPAVGVPPVVGTATEKGLDLLNLREFTWKGWSSVVEYLRQFLDLEQVDYGVMFGGYSRGQIARWESGDHEPPVNFWVRFTRVTGLSLTWVFTGLGDPYVKGFENLPDRMDFRRWVTLEAEKEHLAEQFKGGKVVYLAGDHGGLVEGADLAIGASERVARAPGSKRAKHPKGAG